MENHFEAGLDTLKQKLLTMASHAESAVTRAIKALVDRDDELARRVMAGDPGDVDVYGAQQHAPLLGIEL